MRESILIELNYKEEAKVKISPIGSFKGIDGREFLIDESSISKTIENGVDLVIDINHGSSKEGEVASGWVDINSLEIREDGVYGFINWTELGKELIDKRLYRYLSPAYVMDKDEQRRVLYIDSIGLVNRPNLLTKALNHKSINTLREENESLREINHQLSIDLALERNEILPAQVEFCKSLSEVQFAKFIESNSINIEGLRGESVVGEIKRELNSLEGRICEQLGIGGF